MYIKVLTVSSLNNYIKKSMDNDFILNNIYLKGEISNFKRHESGHLYFSLKDEFSKINAIMFRNDANSLKFNPENGMNVEVKGRVAVYVKDGSYALYCNEIKEIGLGDLYVAYNALKSKLEKQGLFAAEYKARIPQYPKKIGVITSPSGAAIRDIINVTKRRNKNMELVIYPSLVQGEGASKNLIKGIEYFNDRKDIDVIILARGGGSIEELWAFNDEELAYAIFKSAKPIITGVGHETDFTIADFVSDKRAATPSAAAEIAVPSFEEIIYKISNLEDNLNKMIYNDIVRRQNKVDFLMKSLQVNSPLNYVINAYNSIENLKNRLVYNINTKVNGDKEVLGKLYAVLEAHNPLAVLNKGYAVIQDKENNVISDIDILAQSNEINVILKNGSIKGKVNFREEQ